MELVWKDHLSCCKIAEAQIIKIDCENILGLWKISKLTIGTKKINPKENRHKIPRCTWFDNSLYPRGMTNKFHYNKFGIIQIGVEALSQTQIPNNSLKNTKSKNQRFTNTKYEFQIPIAHKPNREPQIISKSCNTPRESKSPNRKIKTKR